MADTTLLIGGGIVAAGLFYFMSQGKSDETTLEDTQATSYVGISGGGTADNRNENIVSVADFLGDCSTPAGDGNGTDDGSNTNICLTPLYLANETIVLEHPMAATNSGFSTYKFTVSIVSDITSSMTEAAFNALSDTQVIGDYSITVSRSGASYEGETAGSGRWTQDQNSTFANGSINKGNAMAPADSVVPTWDECLAAFGGYMPGRIGATGDEVIFRVGNFNDVGQWQYEKQGADGLPYPVTVDKFGLDMSGNVIPMYAQLQYKCPTSYNDAWIYSGPKVQVTSANTLGMVGDNADGSTCYKPCFPAIEPTSGLTLGCTLPSFSITYPNKIYVYCDSKDQDCSDVGTTSLGTASNTEWWNLNQNASTPTQMQKGGWNTPSGAVWGKLFDTLPLFTPGVYTDSQGWYVYVGSGTNYPDKIYVDSILPGFKAAYTRQTKTCICPPETNNAGTTFTITDKSSCPGEGSILEGDDEWKTTHCGGLAPVVGCIDPRASNTCETCVDSDPPNDPCALTNNLCNYPANVVLTECGGVTGGGSGGLGDFTDDVQEYVDTSDNDDGDAVGVIIINPGVGVGSGNSGGNFGGFSAENTLNARNFINTGHSFLNW